MNYVTVPSVARERARRAKEDLIQHKTVGCGGRMRLLIDQRRP